MPFGGNRRSLYIAVTGFSIIVLIWANSAPGQDPEPQAPETVNPHEPKLVATPSFSVPSGTYPKGREVTISDTTPGATIYYTLNGKDPTPKTGQKAIGAIPVPKSATLKAIATAPDLSDSAIASAKYTITTTAPDEWTDEDEVPLRISLIAGYEFEYLSSQGSTQNALVAAYGRRVFGSKPLRSAGPYFSVRLLGAPQQTTTAGIVSLIANSNSSVTTTSLSKVGSALDFDVGLDLTLRKVDNGRVSFEFLAGGGATTPNQSNTVTASYAVPVYGTVECPQLIANLNVSLPKGGLARYGILPGPGTNTTPTPGPANSTACLLNDNGNPTPGMNYKSVDPPINTLTFASPDRRSYFGKAYGGIQIINRWGTSTDEGPCTPDNTSWKNPCERGAATFLLGQDAAITGGKMSHLVFRADVFHPLPLAKAASMIYVFGSLSLRLQGNTLPNVPNTPLILQTASASTTPTPNVNTLVVPFGQPDRDFYRIGFGVSLNSVLSAVAKGVQKQ